MSHIENMCDSIETLATAVHGQLANGVDSVCTEEMSQATDMLKDLNEALYYATIVKEMKDAKEEDETLAKLGYPDAVRGYSRMPIDTTVTTTMPRVRVTSPRTRRGYGRRDYYPDVYDPNNDYSMNRWRSYDDSMTGGSSESGYDRARRGYSETKMKHSGNTSEDKSARMASSEDLVREIVSDAMEMYKDAPQDEKVAFKAKLTTALAQL